MRTPSQSQAKQSSSAWTYHLLVLNDTPLKAHGILLLFLARIAFERLGKASNPTTEMLFILSILFSLIFHEIGHILAAKFFNLKIRESVLYPFGGVSIIQGYASSPARILIAISGPVVSAFIAAMISPWCDFTQDFSSTESSPLPLPMLIFLTNILISILNLIPVTPLDGGKILQAVLELLGVKNPAAISARLGQAFGLFLFVYGLFYKEMLLLLSGAAAFGVASTSYWVEKSKSIAGDLRVRDVMSEKELLLCFTHGTTVSRALTITLKSLQPLFPVLHGDKVVGILSRHKLLQSGAWDTEESYVSAIMDREFPSLEPQQKLSDVIEYLEQYPQEALPVLDIDKNLLGILLKDKILEYLVVQEIRTNNRNLSQQLDDEF